MSSDVAAAVRRELQAFWDADVKKVSPGALGMALQGRPLKAEEAEWIANSMSFAHWEPNLVDGWIVLDADPKGTLR